MRNTKVILHNKDGAELRRIKHNTKYYTVCRGSNDHNNIHEAEEFNDNDGHYLGLGEAYERIFGGK